MSTVLIEHPPAPGAGALEGTRSSAAARSTAGGVATPPFTRPARRRQLRAGLQLTSLVTLAALGFAALDPTGARRPADAAFARAPAGPGHEASSRAAPETPATPQPVGTGTESIGAGGAFLALLGMSLLLGLRRGEPR